MQRSGECVWSPGHREHRSLTRGQTWCGWGVTNNVMGAMEQHVHSAESVQIKGYCPEQGHRGCCTGLRFDRRVFQLDKRSKEVSRWRQQCVQTEQCESLGMITDHESLSLQEPNEAEEGGRAGS